MKVTFEWRPEEGEDRRPMDVWVKSCSYKCPGPCLLEEGSVARGGTSAGWGRGEGARLSGGGHCGFSLWVTWVATRGRWAELWPALTYVEKHPSGSRAGTDCGGVGGREAALRRLLQYMGQERKSCWVCLLCVEFILSLPSLLPLSSHVNSLLSYALLIYYPYSGQKDLTTQTTACLPFPHSVLFTSHLLP
jgi:hypothetical protein